MPGASRIRIPPSNSASAVPSVWTRPADWLPMPDVSASEQKFVGLFAVHNRDSNWVAFSCSGAYTVDWGDGSAPQNFTSGSTASKAIAWADAPSGSLTSEGFRQVLITVTPQAGQNITAFSLNVKHASAGPSAYATGWLDVAISSPSLTSAPIFGGNVAPARRLRRVRWLSYNGATVSTANQFTSLSKIVVCELPGNLKSNAVSSMFSFCSELVEPPIFDTSAVAIWSNFMDSCVSALWVPAYNFSACTSLFAAFLNTYSLIGFRGEINAPLCTSIGSTFANCGMRTLPALVLGVIVSANTCFQNTRIRDASALNFVVGATAFTQAFLNSATVDDIGPIDLSLATASTTPVGSCVNLRRFRAFGFRFAISFLNCQLTRDAIVEIFNNLGTASGAQTVTVTGNPGVASLSGADLAIATGKGWTVAT